MGDIKQLLDELAAEKVELAAEWAEDLKRLKTEWAAEKEREAAEWAAKNAEWDREKAERNAAYERENAEREATWQREKEEREAKRKAEADEQLRIYLEEQRLRKEREAAAEVEKQRKRVAAMRNCFRIEVDKGNINSWLAGVGGVDLLTVNNSSIEGYKLEPGYMPNLLNSMSDQLNILPWNQTLLIFKEQLNAQELEDLTAFINANPNTLPFAFLRIVVTKAQLSEPNFVALTQALNRTNIKSLDLNIEDSLEAAVPELEQLAAQLAYPVAILQGKYSSIVLNTPVLRSFEETLVKNIQQRNIPKLADDYVELEVAPIENVVEAQDDQTARKILLKSLIKSTSAVTDVDQLIKLELVEVNQQQQNEVLELAVEEEQEQQSEYSGDLIDFEKFANNYIYDKAKLELIKHELFGNLPNAIKYFSPDAAAVIRKQLDAFSTMNLDDLPQNFVIKKTAVGELVLDYDLSAPQKIPTPFTPKELPQFSYDHYKKFQNVTPSAAAQKHCQFTVNFCIRIVDDHRRQIWCKYGDVGTQKFIDAINACEQTHEGFGDFMFKHYIYGVDNWEYLLEEGKLINCLDRINHYSSVQLECLKKFLVNSGKHPKYDLTSALDGFDYFWSQWQGLCKQHGVAEDSLNNVAWTTPLGGNPIVYMQRLITILKNARNLAEQCECLDDICLDAYGAYYASRYEYFKLVSKEMEFKYEPENQNEMPFKRDAQLYAVDLQKIIEIVEDKDSSLPVSSKKTKNKQKEYFLIESSDAEIDAAEFERLQALGKVQPYSGGKFFQPQRLFTRVQLDNNTSKYQKLYNNCESPSSKDCMKFNYRFVGQQQQGITLKTYAELTKLKYENDYNIKYFISCFSLLLFVTHDGYNPRTKLVTVLEDMQRSLGKLSSDSAYTHKFAQELHSLVALYQSGVRLSSDEGAKLISIINWNRSSSVRLRQLFKALEQNSVATLKMMNRLCSRERHNDPYDYSYDYALDTADYLQQDNNTIATVYRDDLLLFAELISIDGSEAYVVREPGIEEYNRDAHSPQKLEKIRKNLDKVKEYLLLATENIEQNNLYFAFSRLITWEQHFNYTQFLDAFAEIRLLGATYDPANVLAILDKYKFSHPETRPQVYMRESATINNTLIAIIELMQNSEQFIGAKDNVNALRALSSNDLQTKLWNIWGSIGDTLSATSKFALTPLLLKLRKQIIANAFAVLGNTQFAQNLQTKISDLHDFQDYRQPQQMEKISLVAEQFAQMFAEIMRREDFVGNEAQYTQVFNTLDYSKYNYRKLFTLLDLLKSMPHRECIDILREIFAKDLNDPDPRIAYVRSLHNKSFPTAYIVKMLGLFSVEKQAVFEGLLANILKLETDDPLLKWLLSSDSLDLDTIANIAELSQASTQYRDVMQQLLAKLQAKGNMHSFLNTINKLQISPEHKLNILQIIARCDAMPGDATATKIDYCNLVTMLNQVGIDRLNKFFQETTPNISCLYSALQKRDPRQNLDEFLTEFEKAPFGKRDFSTQFNTKAVERVVNGFKDLNQNAQYSYAYRKQMLDAFMFVNAAGKDLPIYNNLPARSLTNKQLQALFLEIKTGGFKHLEPVQRRLYALALMREAMYRATGKFPYSTQMLALIDCILREGDLIQNIDTGQGKSLIDTMKATMLWLDSDRVDVSTSSIVDAKRDIEVFSPFFTLLGIPHANQPIKAKTEIKDYQVAGINYSTTAQLALFYSKAKAEGQQIGTEDDVVSLVLNESDYTILDDKTIYRYASTKENGLGTKHEWIYTAVNEFVMHSTAFKNPNNSETTDINLLRKHLKSSASADRPLKYLTDEQLLTWIESALIVNYRLQNKKHYVLPAEPEVKQRDKQFYTTRVAKILMKDGKVSPDTQYGNGMQQLLCAKLNADAKTNEFVIDPETNTIISVNNRNMLDMYIKRKNKGVILGSSGSVGNPDEIAEQAAKYDFEFSEVQPHQPKQVQSTPMQICADEAQQFQMILQQLTADRKANGAKSPALVFMRDIETAERFHAFCIQQAEPTLQLYTGMSNEQAAIATAKQPGMLTVTTAALGRNTDVLYDKAIGMTVVHAFVDTKRKYWQRSGRTGREGSPGKIYTILNAQDCSGKPEEYMIKLEQAAKLEREFNENFYNILDIFMRNLGPRDSQFYKQQWSRFSAELEAEYRKQVIAKTYTAEKFIEKMLPKFNNMAELGQPLTVATVLESLNFKYAPRVKAEVFTKPVRIADCTAANIYAEQFKYKTAAEKFAFVQATIRTMLLAYQKKHFISTARSARVTALLAEVNAAKDVASLYAAIAKTKLLVSSSDINANQHRIKPLHLFGSRLQTTLDRSLGVAAIVAGEQANTELVTGLSTQLQTLTPNKSEQNEFSSLDAYKLKTNRNKYADKYNAAVVDKGLTAVLAGKKLVRR